MSSRRISHRRRRGRRPEEDRFLLGAVSGVLILPLVSVLVLLGVTLLAAWLYRLGPVQVVVAVSGSVLGAVLVGLVRARAVAAVLQGRLEAEFQRVAEAVGAAEATMVWTADQLCQGVRPPLPLEPASAGEGAVGRVVDLVGQLHVQGAGALLRVHDDSQAALLVDMHRSLTRRQHVLIDQMLEYLTGLQRSTDDPVLLNWSYGTDHLATRLRRMVESVSVVLGGASLRETRQPVQVAKVLLGAKSEVVKYPRVQLVNGEVGTVFALPAQVHPDVAHLLAELIDNGLDHSDPATPVMVRAQKVAAGLLIEVEDRAVLPMDAGKRAMLNHLLAHPRQADVAGMVRAGCFGLITTAKIAARHGLQVELVVNAMGGTTAHVVIPERYLVPIEPAFGTVTLPAAAPAAVAGPSPAGAGRQQAARSAPGPGGRGPQQLAVSGGDGPLPRRQRVARPMPDASVTPAAPARAANPQAAAEWRTGLSTGLTAGPAPGAAPTTKS
ncbi:ATP-binding protein [Streptomyces sp. Root1310]|uniref:ATP-binding protein n=1 Tax=Streptomyces sp. Root1310 TaxID=1736452 RepID=UPI00070AD5E1|nr:ATP-binding protein [Streptomyces sp. Root1310]KQX77072.1 hypothetical protein ASD48_38470 [Streptomyces sp. Root1310]